MKRQLLAAVLTLSAATVVPPLFAQSTTRPATPGDNASSANMNASPNATPNRSATAGQNDTAAPGAGAMRIDINGQTAAVGQQQIEGQLVDVYTLSQAPSSPAPAAGITNAPAGELTGPGSTNKTTTLGGNVKGTGGAAPTVSNTPVNPGPSFGTYSTPGATGGPGSAALKTGMVSSGIAPTGSVQLKSNPTAIGTASSAGPAKGSSGQVTPVIPPGSISDSAVRAHLGQGVPAAILSNGEVYVLACNPRQLAAYAGETLRVKGQIGAGNVLAPSSIEVRNHSGGYSTIALSTPDNGNGAAPRSANER